MDPSRSFLPNPKKMDETVFSVQTSNMVSNTLHAPPKSTAIVSHAYSSTSHYHQELRNINNNKDSSQHDYFNSFPPGYRFCPTDEELIVFYLMKKVRNEPLPRNQILEIDVYQHNPQIICEKYKSVGEQEWYFFSPRDRKYPNGVWPKRSTQDGYWKNSNSYKRIYSNGSIVGKRNTWFYCHGKTPIGTKTDWAMHEYRLVQPPHQRISNTDIMLDDFFLRKIYKKDGFINSDNKIQTTESFSNMAASNAYGSTSLESHGDQPQRNKGVRLSTKPFDNNPMASINFPSLEHITQTFPQNESAGLTVEPSNDDAYSLEDIDYDKWIDQICLNHPQFVSQNNLDDNTNPK